MSGEGLPPFLEALDGRNFFLLTPLSASPVRLAAIDFAEPNWKAGARFEAVYRTRVFDLNLDDVETSDGAEPLLIDGTNVDTIAYRPGALVLAKNEGSAESDLEVVLRLSVDDPGNYCDCDLPDMGLFTSEKIDIAVEDLDSGDALQWHSI
ncbi:MAG TPA: hypothetical protein VK760_08820 [Candidatus Acidoferrales bacterium]|nr:hypothetical protein [Candidatus Acidoferrales bacterium]